MNILNSFPFLFYFFVTMNWFIRYYFQLKPIYKLLQEKSANKVTFFIDIQNISRGLYSTKTLEYFYYNSDDKLYFEEIIKYINWINKSFKKYDPYIVIFADEGDSKYHRELNSEYKLNRRDTFTSGSDLTTNDLLNVLIRIKRITYRYLFDIQNQLENLSFIYLSSIETDFIPHYIISNNYLETREPDNINILLSIDKDLLQTTKFDNTYQLIIKYSNKTKKSFTHLYDRYNAYKYLIKDEDKNKKYEITAEYIPLILAISGDSSDNIKGIKGYGYKKAIKLIKETGLKPDLSNIDEIENNIIKQNKMLILRNYKLTSFDMLIKELPHKYKVLIESVV